MASKRNVVLVKEVPGHKKGIYSHAGIKKTFDSSALPPAACARCLVFLGAAFYPGAPVRARTECQHLQPVVPPHQAASAFTRGKPVLLRK